MCPNRDRKPKRHSDIRPRDGARTETAQRRDLTRRTRDASSTCCWSEDMSNMPPPPPLTGPPGVWWPKPRVKTARTLADAKAKIPACEARERRKGAVALSRATSAASGALLRLGCAAAAASPGAQRPHHGALVEIGAIEAAVGDAPEEADGLEGKHRHHLPVEHARDPPVDCHHGDKQDERRKHVAERQLAPQLAAVGKHSLGVVLKLRPGARSRCHLPPDGLDCGRVRVQPSIM